MKKGTKRILSFVFAIAMLASMMVVTFAAKRTWQDGGGFLIGKKPNAYTGKYTAELTTESSYTELNASANFRVTDYKAPHITAGDCFIVRGGIYKRSVGDIRVAKMDNYEFVAEDASVYDEAKYDGEFSEADRADYYAKCDYIVINTVVESGMLEMK